MTTFGTSHFVSKLHAIAYYRQLSPDLSLRELKQLVESKLSDGDINLGPPLQLHPSEQHKLVLLDNNTRYGIACD